VFNSAKRRMPPLISRTWPLEPAVRRTVDSIERRSRSVAHPPFLRALILARGLLDNRLLEREIARSMPEMEAAFAREAERVGPDAAARGVGR
jgi:hypothetical protein